MNWDEYFADLCKSVCRKSKDPSTKVGALIIGPDNEIRSTGWNGFPRGVNDAPERYNNRELKYKLVQHGEANAICNAARVGTPLNGCTLYVYPFFPCNECAKDIIQVGIVEVVVLNEREMTGWEEQISISKMMFDEAGVKYRFINPPQEREVWVYIDGRTYLVPVRTTGAELNKYKKSPDHSLLRVDSNGDDWFIPDSDAPFILERRDTFYSVLNQINGG